MMMKNKTAFIFPAFITDFTGHELEFLKENSVNINSYLQRISKKLNIDLPSFSYNSTIYIDNELYSQLLAYAFSCAIFDVLQKEILSNYIAGYSMGIYASLYAANSITLEDGADFIYTAYNILSELAKTKKFGMGAIIGLPIKDVQYIIDESNLEVEIINVNNEHSIVVAGKKEEIKIVLLKSKEEGAMSTVELIVNTPYHSKHLMNFSDLFKNEIEKLKINEAKIPIISTFDQRKIIKTCEIKAELLFNLHHSQR